MDGDELVPSSLGYGRGGGGAVIDFSSLVVVFLFLFQ